MGLTLGDPTCCPLKSVLTQTHMLAWQLLCGHTLCMLFSHTYTGILRVMILSQLAPQRLTVAPEAPMPLAGLLEEVAAVQAGAAADGTLVPGPQSIADSEDGGGGSTAGGYKFREPSISAAAQPAELGWEEQPSALAVGVDGEGGVMKEASSLQDLTSLDGTYEEEGIGTDDSSSTGERQRVRD